MNDTPNVVKVDDTQQIVLDSPVLAMGSDNNSYGILCQGEFIYYLDCSCTGTRKLHEKFRVKLQTSAEHNQVLVTSGLMYIVTNGYVYGYTKTGQERSKRAGFYVAHDGQKEYVLTSKGIHVYDKEKLVYTIEKTGLRIDSSGPDELLVSLLNDDQKKRVHFFNKDKEQAFETKCERDDIFVTTTANDRLVVLRRGHKDGSMLMVLHAG